MRRNVRIKEKIKDNIVKEHEHVEVVPNESRKLRSKEKMNG